MSAVAGVPPPLFANVPPAPPSDHIAETAPPPNEPPSAAVVPPWQIAGTAAPALAVGSRLTVIARVRGALVLQLFVAVTLKLPLVADELKLIVTEFEDPLIVAPDPL